jgi:hypothetical protein
MQETQHEGKQAAAKANETCSSQLNKIEFG